MDRPNWVGRPKCIRGLFQVPDSEFRINFELNKTLRRDTNN